MNKGMPAHTPVLLEEAMWALSVQPGGRYIDCTLGGGGYAAAILEHSQPGGQLLGLDADPEALFERATRSGRRPLLQTEDPRGTFDVLLAARRATYEEASDVRFDSTGLGHDEVARSILEKAMSFRAGDR